MLGSAPRPWRRRWELEVEAELNWALRRPSVCTLPVLEDAGLVYQSSLTAIAEYHGWVARTTHFDLVTFYFILEYSWLTML